MIAIHGNTYPVKDQLKALGGKWDADNKAWMVPENKAVEARKLVTDTPKSNSHSHSSGNNYRPRKCIVCGRVPKRNSRGYTDTVIYRSGECRDCYEERKMGY